MARILVGSIPVAGHIEPLVPIVRALIERGHEVCWYTGRKYQPRVEETGARFSGMSQARDFDDAQLDREVPERSHLRGIAQLKFDMKHVFIDSGPGQLRDIENIAASFPPDVMFCEAGTSGAMFHAERTGVPLVLLGVIPLPSSSIDTAPFGLGLAPDRSTLGRLRNRSLNWAVEHVLFRDVQRHWNATRRQLGLAPTGWWLNAAGRATLYLQPTIPSLEHPRSDMPANLRFIGMIPPDPPRNWIAPDFWSELDGPAPVVHVTQGTLANSEPTLIAPALEGLAGENVLVVVATGGRTSQSLGLHAVPRNARIATFLPYAQLLPKTSIMVTNGGYGGVQMALAHGVPVAIAGSSEDKPEVAMRVACSGAGIDLKTGTPTARQVRESVRALLQQKGYRARARALADEYRQYDSVKLAVEAVEGAMRR